MTTRILIMGLPGSGKTTLAEALRIAIWQEGRTCGWINADQVRKQFDDWDFSHEGRIRQSWRMYELSLESNLDYCIADFVAPLVEMRDNFKPNVTIWVDTIRESRYPDTDAVFVAPETYDFRVTEQDADAWAETIVKSICRR